jgi:hypothetical protein
MADHDGAAEQPMEAEGAGTGARRSSGAPAGKRKGRGFVETDKGNGEGGNMRYEALDSAGGNGPAAKSVEGWVLFVTGLHEEAQVWHCASRRQHRAFVIPCLSARVGTAHAGGGRRRGIC